VIEAFHDLPKTQKVGTGPLQLPPSLDTRSKSVYHSVFDPGNGRHTRS
jgi:hypothetical protein